MKKVLVSYFLFFLLVYEAQSRKKGEAASELDCNVASRFTNIYWTGRTTDSACLKDHPLITHAKLRTGWV